MSTLCNKTLFFISKKKNHYTVVTQFVTLISLPISFPSFKPTFHAPRK